MTKSDRMSATIGLHRLFGAELLAREDFEGLEAAVPGALRTASTGISSRGTTKLKGTGQCAVAQTVEGSIRQAQVGLKNIGLASKNPGSTGNVGKKRRVLIDAIRRLRYRNVGRQGIAAGTQVKIYSAKPSNRSLRCGRYRRTQEIIKTLVV